MAASRKAIKPSSKCSQMRRKGCVCMDRTPREGKGGIEAWAAMPINQGRTRALVGGGLLALGPVSLASPDRPPSPASWLLQGFGVRKPNAHQGWLDLSA